MPPLLAVNAAVNNDEHFKFWIDHHSSRFLQPSVTLPMRDADGALDAISDESVTYDLRVSSTHHLHIGLAVHITSGLAGIRR